MDREPREYHRGRQAGATRLMLAIAAATGLVAVVAVVLSRTTDPTPPSQVAPAVQASDDAGVSTTSAPATTSVSHRDGGVAQAPLPPLAAIPPAGTVEFEWREALMPMPPRTEGFVEVVTETPAGFVAVGQGYGEQEDGSLLLAWESPDGLNWRLSGGVRGIPTGFQVEQIVATGQGFMAVGGVSQQEPPWEWTAVVASSLDGLVWTVVTPEVDLAEGERLSFNSAAGGDVGVVVMGSIDFEPGEPPLEIHKDGLTLTIDNNSWTLEITDDATGRVVYSGSPDDVYGQESTETDEGLQVFHPETGEVMLVVPWEVIETVDESLNSADDGGESGDFNFELGGFSLTITGLVQDNPEGASFEIRDLSSGSVVFEGVVSELFEGPPPRFVADDGTVVLDFGSWVEYWDAEGAAYEEFNQSFEDEFYSKPLVLLSTDTRTWTEIDLGRSVAANQTAYVQEAVYGSGGFVLRGTVENRDTFQGIDVSWISPDGSDWELETATGSEGRYLSNVTATPTGFIALAEGAVFTSSDGIGWEPVLVINEPGAYTFFNSVAAGALGTLASVESHPDQFPCEDGIVEGVPGEHEGATTTIAATATTGAPAAAPPTTAPAAILGCGEFAQPEGLLFFSPDGRNFYEVTGDEALDGMFIGRVFVGSDRAIILGNRFDEGFTDEEFDTACGDVGDECDVEDEFVPQPLVVLVGTPVE